MSGEKTHQGCEAQHSKKRPRLAFNYLKEFGGAYQDLLGRQINTWADVLHRMESGDYTADQWVGDVARMSTQWVRGLCQLGAPWLHWSQPGHQTPSLVFVVDTDAEAADPEVIPLPIGVAQGVPIQVMGFSSAGQGCLDEDHVFWTFDPDGTHIWVGLKDLKTKPINPGIYRCLICCRDPQSNRVVPLASVEVVKRPVEGVKRPVEGVKRPVEGVKRPVEGVKRPVKGVKRPVKGVKRPVKGVKR